MTVLMNPQEGESGSAVTIDCRALLGGHTATSGQIHNLGPLPFRYVIGLNGAASRPITVMDGTKWTVPCYFDSVTVLPRAGQVAHYSLDAEAEVLP